MLRESRLSRRNDLLIREAIMADTKEYPIDQRALLPAAFFVQEENREEQELSAFTFAVTQLFGPEHAKLSERIWLDESDLMDSPPLNADRNVRAVTVAASFRLAAEKDFDLPPPC
jgi:hypothetical protein